MEVFGLVDGPPADTVERIVEAGLRCVARQGLAATSLEDIAREAGCGRSSVYRVFPGGRAEVVGALGVATVRRVGTQVAAAVAAAPPRAEERVVTGLVAGATVLRADPVVQAILTREPEVLVPWMGFPYLERTLAEAASFGVPTLQGLLGPRRAAQAAEWVARLLVSDLALPWPGVDLGDPSSARRLVRAWLHPLLVDAPTHAAPAGRDAPPTGTDPTTGGTP